MASERSSLSGTVALVTGGAVGIGREIAVLRLAEDGADVALTYLSHRPDEALAAIRALGAERKRYRSTPPIRRPSPRPSTRRWRSAPSACS